MPDFGPLTALFFVVSVIPAMLLHELAHGWLAVRRGDPTPRRMGRMTSQPRPHIDVFGSIIVPALLLLPVLFGRPGLAFGYAKPMPIEPSNLRDPDRDMTWIALAGIATNVVLAAIGAVAYRLVGPGGALGGFLFVWVFTNALMAVFHLIPLPPFDASRILARFLPPRARSVYQSWEPYGALFVLVLVGEFPVVVPVFSGPFRVLAELILDRKVDVCDVPVARVTEDFLARAEEAEGWTLEEATWFLTICAVLLELKVGRLFPRTREPDEEDLLGGSPDLAFARRIELAAFRSVAAVLAQRLELASRSFLRRAPPPQKFAHLYPDLMERVTPKALAEAAAGLLRSPTVDLSHVTPIVATVEDAVAAVTRRMSRRGEARFRDLVRDCRERIDVVVRFLALLELHARGRVALRQAETFGDIEVRWEG